MKFNSKNITFFTLATVQAQSSDTPASPPASPFRTPGSPVLGGPGVRNLAMARSMLSEILTGNTLNGEDPYKLANSLIKEYGCFCYPEGQKTVGSKFNYHGAAVDEVDELCRNLFFKQKCFPIDSENGFYDGINCETDNRFRWYMDNDTNLPVCGDRQDPNYYARKPCKMNNCELEREFVIKVAELYQNGYQANPDYKKMDDASYQAACPAVQGTPTGKSRDLQCCGTGNARRTYDSVIKECCLDTNGKETGVKIIGNCN
jgi:hypothetical protein